MKKVFLINFDVGSGIEYTGNMFLSILEEKHIVYNYKHQNPSFIVLEELIKQRPDIIVVNEFYSRIVEGLYSYKLMRAEVKIVQIFHDWKRLNNIFIDGAVVSDQQVIERYYISCVDRVFYLNFKPIDASWNDGVKFINPVGAYFPVSNADYKVITPWSSRSGACYIGNILPLRISQEFLFELKKYPEIVIDCYGKTFENEYAEYYDEFNALSNINYCGMLAQDKVCETLNKYKYFIISHENKPEVFLIILLQAILCGTIPLVCNNRSFHKDHYRWIDWADSFYFGYNAPNEMLDALMYFVTESIDLSFVSEDISKRACEKYSFSGLKEMVLSALEGI